MDVWTEVNQPDKDTDGADKAERNAENTGKHPLAAVQPQNALDPVSLCVQPDEQVQPHSPPQSQPE